MRLFKASILLMLIVKSSFGFSMMPDIGVDACCTTGSELVVESHDVEIPIEEEKGCCDLNCDCFCCAHTFIGEQSRTFSEGDKAVCTELQSSYSNNYFFLVLKAIWQPPRRI